MGIYLDALVELDRTALLKMSVKAGVVKNPHKNTDDHDGRHDFK